MNVESGAVAVTGDWPWWSSGVITAALFALLALAALVGFWWGGRR